MIDNNGPILLFQLADKSIDNKPSIWTPFSHTGIYVTAIGLLIPTGLGIFCCSFIWCQPAILVHPHFQSGSTWHTIVDDHVEAAPIYRSDGKTEHPAIGPCESGPGYEKKNLHRQRVNRSNKHHQKQFLNPNHWIQIPEIKGTWWAHMVSCKT